eukprot:jgi/Ulvmu1/10966/UM007_0145.1
MVAHAVVPADQPSSAWCSSTPCTACAMVAAGSVLEQAELVHNGAAVSNMHASEGCWRLRLRSTAPSITLVDRSIRRPTKLPQTLADTAGGAGNDSLPLKYDPPCMHACEAQSTHMSPHGFTLQ